MINSFATDCYYHIYNRGVEKRNIFSSKRDYFQFLLTLNYYRKNPLPAKLSNFKRGIETIKIIENQKELVEIFCYCLMPNHFHLLLKQCIDGGITKFLKNISNSYTRYFNTKYKRIGPLFQGTSKSKLIENDEYLLQLSKYIHRNPLNLSNSLSFYSYSSYSCYLNRKKHSFCNTEFILSYFSKNNPKLGYKRFIEETDIDDDPRIYKTLIDHED